VDQQSTNHNSQVIDYTQFPDKHGHFGIHGGRFVSETLIDGGIRRLGKALFPHER